MKFVPTIHLAEMSCRVRLQPVGGSDGDGYKSPALGSLLEEPCVCCSEIKLVVHGPKGIFLGPRNASLQGTDPYSTQELSSLP